MLHNKCVIEVWILNGRLSEPYRTEKFGLSLKNCVKLTEFFVEFPAKLARLPKIKCISLSRNQTPSLLHDQWTSYNHCIREFAFCDYMYLSFHMTSVNFFYRKATIGKQ